MNEVESMYIGIDLTSAEYASLCDIASEYDTSVGGLLSQFIADLTGSERSGGSDERRLASDWLDRSIYNFPLLDDDYEEDVE